MPQAARKGDLTVHGGVIAEGSPDVTIGGLPAARLIDKHICPLHGPGPVTKTSETVFINKVGVADQAVDLTASAFRSQPSVTHIRLTWKPAAARCTRRVTSVKPVWWKSPGWACVPNRHSVQP